MKSFTNLSNKRAAQHSIILAFSYSLTHDGSPGPYNEQIAQSIRTALRTAWATHKTIPWTGMQWEIHDAMADQDEWDSFKPARFVPKSHVASPPTFKRKEIKDTSAFIYVLTEKHTQAARTLAKHLTRAGWHARANSTKFISFLNKVLDDRTVFRDYLGTLEIHDLHRIQLGAVGSEKRSLPSSSDYPNGLRAFQARRINRLIIESIVPNESILERGEYLSTRGVLKLLLPRVKRDVPSVKYVYVFGHPAHSPRCRSQTIAALKDHCIKIDDANVVDVHKGQQWPRDPSTAQVWCRSDDNWKDYENMGKRREN